MSHWKFPIGNLPMGKSYRIAYRSYRISYTQCPTGPAVRDSLRRNLWDSIGIKMRVGPSCACE